MARPDGARAVGAGLLSLVGELDIDAMGTAEYDIAAFQPTLFSCRSLGDLVDMVGEFFATACSAEVDERARCASAMG